MTASWLDGPATVRADGTYFRVARSDQPLSMSWIQPADAALESAGNRFDVVGGGALYLGSTATGCYAETTARFRPAARVRAAVGDEPGFVMCGGIPADWRARRLEVEVEVPDGLPFVDVESSDTHSYLNAVMAPPTGRLGHRRPRRRRRPRPQPLGHPRHRILGLLGYRFRRRSVVLRTSVRVAAR